MIVRDDVVYVFILGKVLLKDEETIDRIDLDDVKPPTVRRKK